MWLQPLLDLLRTPPEDGRFKSVDVDFFCFNGSSVDVFEHRVPFWDRMTYFLTEDLCFWERFYDKIVVSLIWRPDDVRSTHTLFMREERFSVESA